MTDKQLLKRALKALQSCSHKYAGTRFQEWYFDEDDVKKAITAIRARLEQPEQEPLFADIIAQHPGLAEELKAMDAAPVQEPTVFKHYPEYSDFLSPPAAPVQELTQMNGKQPPAPWNTPEAQRQWVGLTDEEVKYEWEAWKASLPRYAGFAKGIEAKLRAVNGFSCDATEKNGGAA